MRARLHNIWYDCKWWVHVKLCSCCRKDQPYTLADIVRDARTGSNGGMVR